jgi:hypothetical protein
MPLALVSGIKEAEPHLVKQLLYSGIVNFGGPWFYLKAAAVPAIHHPTALQERWSPVRVCVHAKNVP